MFTGIIEVKRPSFHPGTRYGRSNGGPKGLRITPRRDFHFLRYGKRAHDYDDSTNTPQPSSIQCYEPLQDYVLSCSFTGVRDFYRCWKGYELNHILYTLYTIRIRCINLLIVFCFLIDLMMAAMAIML